MMNPLFFSRFSMTCALIALAGCASNSPAPVENRAQTLQGIGATSLSAPSGPGYHTVQKGETLYGIALEYGQDYREVAAWNYIVNPNAISEGQVLRVLPPESAQTATSVPVSASAVVEQRALDGATSASANTATLKREPKVNKEPYSDAAYQRAQNTPNSAATPTATTPPPPPSATPSTAAATSPPPATTSGLSWSWPAGGKTIGSFAQTKGIDIAGKAGDPVLAAADGKVVYVGSGLRGYGQLVIIKHNAAFLSAYAHNQKILVKEGQEVKRGVRIAEMGKTDSDAVKLHFEVRRQGQPVDPLNFLPRQ
jgi:lipoprotein NlpD